ncbi:uncharacterized protein LOC112557460 isoform X2 [Pomacea canaliculata]|uniref:uncharacterized protein LOC112557460 isoform X2 n=1 Tax=Pomacea canaliculata TaxID=400727 RepID=UPI000D726E6D|nr:uncharacterized protein LOC112557460 isoform X2 [Pomacea canaliculata]
MADEPPSSLQTGEKWAGYTTPLTTGSRVEKATVKPGNQAKEEAYAKMVSKKLAWQRQKQHFQASLQQKLLPAERYEAADEILTRKYEERRLALEPRGVSMGSTRKLWKTGLEGESMDPFDIYTRKNLTIRHHIAQGRWKNEGTFLTKNETEPRINMYPTAKDFPLEESQEAWIQWVNDAFPNLHGTNFWLPVCAKDFASLYCSEKQSTLDTSQQHAPWYNSVKNDSALQRVLLCLKERSEAKDEVMFVLSQMYFGQKSGEPCYSAAADYLPPSHSVPPAPLRNWEEGDFDLLIIHRRYGLVVCEVKAFGDNSSKSGMSQQDVDSKIRSKLKEAILQVDRAEAVLSHLVSDIVPGLRITKTIAFPNLTARQIQQALAEDPILTEALCRCLGATDVTVVTDLCLTSDQLSVSGTPGIVSTDFGNWWLRCVVGSGSATEISFADYQRLLARFCGPAVTVTVPCLSPPRLSLKTLEQLSSSTSLCHAVITLFPEQVHLLNTATPRVFLAGPPGTGKSLVLQLKATEWLRCGCDVIVVRPRRWAHAASLITYYLLEQTIETQLAPTGQSGQLHLLECDFYNSGDIEEALTDLLRAAKGRPLYVIVDALVSPFVRNEWYNIRHFVHKLLTRVPDLHCWAAGYDLEFSPSSWQVQHFTRPIRFPKSVEMELADFRPGIFKPYSQRGQHDTTHGPPVQWFLLPKHDQRKFIDGCDMCGELVVRFLKCLLAGASENTTTSLTSITSTKRDTTSPSLPYRDVLIVKGRYDHINLEKALENAGVPVQDMTDYITEDMVTSNRDEVWMVSTDELHGLERKVVVVVGETEHAAFHCTSQLVFISQTGLPEPWPIVEGRRNNYTDWKYAERHFVPEKKPVSHINIYQTAKEFKFEESRDLWIQWVKESFPDLLHSTYFWRPAGADLVHNIQDFGLTYWREEQYASRSSQQCPPQDNNSALQRVLFCLEEISEAKDEVMFVLSQLCFGQNSGQPCYSAAADYLPPPDSVPPAPPRNWEEGDSDLLIIHRTYGLVVCEVKAFGDNSSKSGMSQQDVDSKIRSKLKEAILQVDMAEAVLSHLVSDIVPGLRITKTIAFPNLTGHQVQQALAEDPILTKDLCRCLEAADLVSVVGLCLCSEQLYLSGALQDVSTELWEWWLRCVVRSRSETAMTSDGYETLVARFCGSTVTVTIPRLCLKILNQPSPFTTQCSYAVITLFPEQVHLLTMTSPRVMLAGLPGTGKSIVLQLKATEWLRCGSDVFLVCTSDSCAACYRMYYLLQQTIETQLAPSGTSGQLHLREYRFRTDSDVYNAVRDLSQAATGGVLHVIADEMDSSVSYRAQIFWDKLLTQVPHLYFWAASNYLEIAPSRWQVQYLTIPIRFSETYSLRGEYESPRGPPVQRFPLPRHKGSHRSTRRINRCVTCGEHVAKILMDVLADVPGNITTTSTAIAPTRSDTTSVRLQYRDVLVLPSIHVRYFMDLETGLRKAGIPVRCMRRDNLEDIVTAREDEVVVADEDDARGLERKVVVAIVDELEDVGLLTISRCRSQLVFITYREYYGDCDLASEDESQQDQKEDIRTDKSVTKCHVTESEDIEILTSSTLDTDPQCSSVPHPTIPDLSEASLPPNVKPDRSPDECRSGDTTENSDDISPSPGISPADGQNAETKSDQNSDEGCGVESDTNVEETQEKERRKCEASAPCSKKGAEDTEIQKDTNSKCYSFPFKINLDLREAAAVTPPQHIMESGCPRDDRTDEVSDTSDDTFSSPIFSDHWQVRGCFSAAGGRLQKQGSDVVLQVPAGAIEDNTKVTVHAAVCANDVYIKHKLQLPSTETIVSPLAEFKAGHDFCFQNHIQITLPTCLSSDYDVNLLHVYCITHGGQEEEINISKIQRLQDMTEAPDKEALEVYFYVNEERQVEVMTSHFSGYVCTYCGLCQNIGLEVYASPTYDDESVQVSVIAQLWDKIHIQTFDSGSRMTIVTKSLKYNISTQNDVDTS